MTSSLSRLPYNEINCVLKVLFKRGHISPLFFVEHTNLTLQNTLAYLNDFLQVNFINFFTREKLKSYFSSPSEDDTKTRHIQSGISWFQVHQHAST